MSKAYFDLDIQGKKDLKAKREDKRPEAFSSDKPVEEKTTTVETTTEVVIVPEEPAHEEEVAHEETEVAEYPLNED